jgi:hypothetical protein
MRECGWHVGDVQGARVHAGRDDLVDPVEDVVVEGGAVTDEDGTWCSQPVRDVPEILMRRWSPRWSPISLPSTTCEPNSCRSRRTCSGKVAIVVPPMNGWTVINWPRHITFLIGVSRWLSGELNTVASSVDVFEGDDWSHVAISGGEIRDRYSTNPRLHELMAAWQDAAVPAPGDITAAARLAAAYTGWDTAIDAIEATRRKQMAAGTGEEGPGHSGPGMGRADRAPRLPDDRAG